MDALADLEKLEAEKGLAEAQGVAAATSPSGNTQSSSLEDNSVKAEVLSGNHTRWTFQIPEEFDAHYEKYRTVMREKGKTPENKTVLMRNFFAGLFLKEGIITKSQHALLSKKKKKR